MTYICCVILNSIQILLEASRTYIHIHEWIFFGHLLLRIHYSMAPPGLDPEEGSQRFIPFLVGLLGFRFRAVTFNSEGCVFLVQNVWMCACTYNPTSIGSLFLFSFCFQLWLWFHLLPRRLVLNFTQGSVGRPFATRNIEVLMNPCTLAGRAIFFFKCAVVPGLHTDNSYSGRVAL